MRQVWLAFLGVCLLWAGCSQSGDVTTAPTQTLVPPANATVTHVEERAPSSPTTAEVPMVVQETVAITATTAPTATLVQYRNANPYLPEPQFEVSYDSAVWAFDQTMEANDRLLHRTIENCDFRLQAGPVGAPSVDTAQLANREWTIALVQPNILLYWFSYETIGFDFGLVMPTDYAATEKSPCQVAAEQVIATFQIVE